MGKGSFHDNLNLNTLTLEEVQKHNTKKDRWIIIDGSVYDVTNFAKRHPGGEKIIQGYAGQDATDAWTAFHIDRSMVSKYMKPLLVGKLEHSTEYKNSKRNKIEEDFRKLRQKVEEMGLFKPSVLFFSFILGHILVMEAIGIFIMYYYGTGWLPYVIAAIFLTAAQAQAGWAQHDYGHLSVLPNSKLNHWAHIFVINFLKGASSDWWNYRHFNHHSKPNVVKKDPDIRLDMFFVLGKVIPIEWAKKKKGFMPYQHQHKYFYLILPPLLLPLYFNYEIPYYLLSRKRYGDLFWMLTFFLRYELIFYPLLGFWGTLGLFFFVRFIESHWFVWTTQMSHIPMDVNYDQDDDWVTGQLKSTCNVEPSLFNDWFSGHLNFQIEHHLFPTMPRHNLIKVKPLVMSLCKKHNIKYHEKTLLEAMVDIHKCLRESGELWMDSYYHK
ncbi:DgyrCDS13142 [Dimorphilus gyrociliatus]|uniref:DgyrCDS13142 n=1 Tax=Dimorphilus gyrociliatus TaxID=2664684 RepID=A0A7I8W9S1_9ANNE|nr:DgyrCDS13142 [Dimorphilus gyrociliatus]